VQRIADYDSNDYDYRTYWDGRDYEQWAEDRALTRLVPLLGRPDWFVDFGGGFGRNARHYRDVARHYVIADGSANNLRTATVELADDLAAGRAFLVRCDLNALPFVDAAFDAAIVVRVLHHLADIDGALTGMARTVGDRFLLDIPIKHHALALALGRWRTVRGPAPLRTGSSESPFWNFRLSAIRDLLAGRGWQTRVVASVNNLRRWDRMVPDRLVPVLGPVARWVETVGQPLGRGWWGPSQFLMAQRDPVRRATPRDIPAGVPVIAARMACPSCRGELTWTPSSAGCASCGTRYRKVDAYWDFAVSG
jgi:SAM-dependent methyltransferase